MITDERLQQLAYDPMMCNVTPDFLACFRELIEARAQLAALQWRPITAEDLPQAREEVGGPWGDGWRVDQVTKLKLRLYTTVADWVDEEYLYHRPIAPPADKAGA
jgi:hypothetical protein